MRQFRGLVAVAISVVMACGTSSDPTAGVDGSTGTNASGAVGGTATTSFERAALDLGVAALSLDDAGRPRMLRAVTAMAAPAGATVIEAARAHVATLAPAWGADARAPADLAITSVHTLPSGATVVSMRQEIDGIEIEGGAMSVLLDGDLRLLAITGVRASAIGAPRGVPTLSAADAMVIAIADRFGAIVPSRNVDVDVAPRAGAWHALQVTPRTDVTLGPAQAKRQVSIVNGALTSTWAIELYGARSSSNNSELWRVVVDATTGAIIRRISLTHDVAFSYRVWADADAAGRPHDGPTQSFLPHPTGTADGSAPAFTTPNLVSMDAFNRNPSGAVDPWLAANATTSRGNNADAYVDLLDTQDGFTNGTDFRASTTGTRTFDRTYNTAQGPLVSQNQQMAAITNLFYTVNWLHDWWYDSGFNESGGNAQIDNFGRGGSGNDPILAEAQDDANGGSRDNANMSTPSDGMSPKMQMFLWSGVSTHTLTANPGNLSFANGTAAFGPQTFDVTDTVVVASAADGCSAINNANGNIVIVDRGTCNFDVKAGNVRQGGGVGMILANNGAGTVEMAGTGANLPPTLSVSQADGATLKQLVAAGGATARMFRSAAGVERDGDLDIGIIAHEWGHYLHHRLTSCTSAQCDAQSEGWGDFNALHLLLRPTDDPHGTFATAAYAGASFADAYFGIRRAPYSTNFARNGFTFRHIQESATLPTTFPIAFSGNNSESHNAGEVWAAMMWEAYVGLIDARGYTAARRAMSDYVVAGLRMAPVDATFTETRDAIILAAAAVSSADAVTIAAAFARRGAGSCAVSPPRTSTTFDGVVEDFNVSGKLAFGSVTLTDDVVSCDADAVLDAGETGTLSVTVVNNGAGPLSATTLGVTSSTTGVTVVDGPRTIAPLPAFSSRVERFSVRLDSSVTARTTLAFAINASDAGACGGTATTTASIRGNYDVVLANSATDDVEAPQTVWTRAGVDADKIWSRELIGTGMAWHGVDWGSQSDTQLASPPLIVGASAFTMGFAHKFDFEFSSGPPTYWDGGVIEISTDGGATWTDVSMLGVNPGYVGTIDSTAGNPLAGRTAYARRNAAYPNRNNVSLNFGTRFSGQTIRVRFRIGTDQAAGAYGWEIDDIAFGGITNRPFATVVDDASVCTPPIDAGIDAPPPPVDAAVDAPLPPIDAAIDAPDPIDATGPSDASDDGAPADVDASADVDAATDVDASTGDDARIDARGGGGGEPGGCDCRAGARTPNLGAFVPFLMLGLVLRRRRRRDSRARGRGR